MFKNKKFMMILSLLIAIILWFYVMNEIDPVITKKYRAVPVHYVNEEELEHRGLRIANASKDIAVDISLKGKRSQLMGYKAQNLQANVDLSGLNIGEHLMFIELEIKDAARRGVELVDYPSVVVKIIEVRK